MIKSGGIDKFILKVEKDNRAKDFETGRAYKGVDGKDIVAVNVNTERWYATQIGTIVALPARITDKHKNIPICNVGDELIIHHNVTTAFDEGSQQLIREFYWEGEQYFHVEPEAIFALLKGEEICPFGNRIFLEPIKNEEQNFSGIIIPPATEYDDRHGVVRYFSEQGNGITEGDKAFFIEGGFYSVLVKNKRWLIPVQSNLYGKVVDDELIPYGNYILVEPEKQVTSSIYIPDEVSSIKPLYGTVLSKGAAAPKYIRIGSKVGFRPANHPKYKDYYILSEDRIHYGQISTS
jgi:co-chaperonin GroES (HSP10)